MITLLNSEPATLMFDVLRLGCEVVGCGIQARFLLSGVLCSGNVLSEVSGRVRIISPASLKHKNNMQKVGNSGISRASPVTAWL